MKGAFEKESMKTMRHINRDKIRLQAPSLHVTFTGVEFAGLQTCRAEMNTPGDK